MNANRYIGCCGAYCKTCKVYLDNFCKGCKLGYDTGGRDITKAKCKIKVCCFKELKYDTCAECSKLDNCIIIGNFYSHISYKYKKYRQSIEFIKSNGYSEFLRQADKWKGAYGKLN